MQGYTRDTIKEDIKILASTLRPSDIAEVTSASGLSVMDALEVGRQGDVCKTICTSEGTPVAIFGSSPTDTEGLGSVWMVATTAFNKVHRQFLKECREGVRELSKGYKALFNYTDARNTVHHRWLKWCGFVFINKHENYGVNGETFIEFVRISEDK